MTVVKLRRLLVLTLLCGLCSSSFVTAQLPQTRLYSLSPNGGQIGQEFEVRLLSGDDLEEISQLVFSHPDIKTRQKTVENAGTQAPVDNSFIVTIPDSVPSGVYEVRCGGLFGYSNPRRFAIDHTVVAADPAENNSAEKAAPLQVGQVVNGRLESGNDVDWFRLSAKAGQRLVFDTWAERLDSKMNPVIAIYDSTGRRRLDWSRNSIGFDPILAFDVPAEGDYCVQIRDITYRNGNEYFYRLHVHTNPHIEFVWPPVAQAGSKSMLTLYGYNLPGSLKSGQQYHDVALESVQVEVNIPAQPDLLDVENRVRPVAAATDAFSYRFTADGISSNPVRIGITPLKVATEVEPNDQASQAQAISVPIEIGGQFGKVGDSDTYRFEAKAGEVYFVDVLAERLGTTADPYLVVNQIIKAADGMEQVKRLTALDDVATNLLANVFETKTDDPVFRLQVPADGTYEVVLRDRYWESRGNPLLRYSLAIRQESPDFRVVAIPSAPTIGLTWPTGLRKGDQFPLAVLAFRQDQFNGPIEISADEIPAGLSCPPVVIGEGETSSTLIVTSSSDAPVGLYSLKLKASAVLSSPVLQRSVTAAQQAVDNAAKPIADLQKKRNDASEKAKQPLADYDAALKSSQDQPDDANLKTQTETLKKGLDPLIAARDAAAKALNDAETTLNNAKNGLVAAKQDFDQSQNKTTHEVRSGTVVWSTAANVPAISRITNSVAVSVIDEAAPFQVKSDLQHIRVHQGRQILIPFQLEKRSGFDDKVTLTTQGIPKNANIDFPNSALEKGEASKTLAMFVKESSPPASYTIWMRTQGQVGYQRNPAKAERLKQVSDQAKAKADESKQAEQAATQKKNEATAAFTQAQQKLPQTQAAVKAAETAVTTGQAMIVQLKKTFDEALGKSNSLQAQVTKMTAETATAEQLLAAKQKELDAANSLLTAEQSQFDKLQTEAKAADEKVAELTKQVSQQPENAELKTQLETQTQTATTAKQSLAAQQKKVQEQTSTQAAIQKQMTELAVKQTQIQTQLKTLQEQLIAALKMKTDAENKAKAAAEEQMKKTALLEAAKKDVATADAALKTATTAKTEAEAAEKGAQAVAKATEATRVAAEKAATDAANAAKAKNINFTPPTTAVVVEVLPAPTKLAATVPNGGKVKQGEALEVTLKVTRQNGFAGPVQLTLALPPSVQGITADPVDVPADQSDAKLTIKTTAEAPAGKIEHVVVRAAMEFNGQAEVDAPVTIELTK